MKRSHFIFALVVIILGAAPCPGATDLVTELQQAGLRYFVENTNPVTDSCEIARKTSRRLPIAATTASPRLPQRDSAWRFWPTAAAAASFPVLKRKRKILTGLQFALTGLEHHNGWFYHFLDWKTGARFEASEVSTIDTAWFLAGALYAGEVLGNDRIRSLANRLYDRVDFPEMMTNGGKLPLKRTLTMGWLPEQGYLNVDWDSYAENIFLNLLGLGHRKNPLPDSTWLAWARPRVLLADGKKLIGPGLPLFAHQYSQIFVDLRTFHDKDGNYFENSILATLRDKRFCGLTHGSTTFVRGFWGLSASDSPDGYTAFSPAFQNGTVCPACSGASAVFSPKTVLEDLDSWASGPYREFLWEIMDSSIA